MPKYDDHKQAIRPHTAAQAGLCWWVFEESDAAPIVYGSYDGSYHILLVASPWDPDRMTCLRYLR